MSSKAIIGQKVVLKNNKTLQARPTRQPKTPGLFGPLSTNPGSATANRQFGEALQQNIGFFDDHASHFGIRSLFLPLCLSMSVFVSVSLPLFLPLSKHTHIHFTTVH